MLHRPHTVVSHEEDIWGVSSTWMIVVASSVVICCRIRHQVERQSKVARSDHPAREINACHGRPGNVHLLDTTATHVRGR